MPVLTLHPEFGYVILAAATMSFQCMMEGIPISKLRKKYGINYPDMGNGRYAAKLTDDQWKEFNNAQRVHYNYIEGLPFALVSLIGGGVFNPKLHAALGAAYIVGRILYGLGYRSKGANGRFAGVLIVDVALLAMFGSTIYQSLKFSGLI